MFSNILTTIASNYPFFLSMGIAFLVTLRVFIVIFLERTYEWSGSMKKVAGFFFLSFGVTYFTALFTFYLGIKMFRGQLFFIMVYYLVIINSLTIYVLRKSDEGLGFQTLTAALNLFHIFFAIILISPPRYVNALNSENLACVIDSHCRRADCSSPVAADEERNKSKDCFASRKCVNYSCQCEKVPCVQGKAP
jgi:hypothetical protein